MRGPVKKKAQHLARRVGSACIGIRRGRVTAGPSVPAAMHEPVLHGGLRGPIHRARVGAPACLAAWMTGVDTAPTQVFLKAVDLVMDEAVAKKPLSPP